MDLPASFYGTLDKRNPVIISFNRDIKSFLTLMKKVASSGNIDNSRYARGIKILVETRNKYKHRLPSTLYQEHLLQIADFLYGLKLYQLALWHGYRLCLLQFSSVEITEITDVDQLRTCFFPEGFDTDQDTLAMKIRAMHGCALCIFEEEKQHSILSQNGLCKVLSVLNFIRMMSQAFQQRDHLCLHIYNGSTHIYAICRYLMTMKYSAQALEYLLWASISLEISIPLMRAQYLPFIATLYCAVCHCYYDNQAEVQAEKFARRALGKIQWLAELEDFPATREAQRAYKEASIKLEAMIFKRAVKDARRKPDNSFGIQTRRSLKDIPNGQWPRTPTEHMLTGQFDCSAGQFLAILETLWDSNTRPLQMRLCNDPQEVEVVLELVSAGISILSGATSTGEKRCDGHPCLSPVVLTPTSTLTDLALTGENKVPIMSAVRFIKLLFQHKQLDAFTEFATEMLQVLSGVEGHSFRKAEWELALLYHFNSLLDSMNDAKHKSSFLMSTELTGLVETLHKSVCDSAPEVQPNEDLVLEILFFLWGKVKMMMQKDWLQTPEWVWCLYMLCEVAFACDLATVDCMMMAEMSHTLGLLLESTAECYNQTAPEGDCDNVKPSPFSLLGSSSTELLPKVCEVMKKALEALARGVATLLPQDCSAYTDSAFMQHCISPPPLTPAVCSATSKEGNQEVGNVKEKEMEAKAETDVKSRQRPQSTSMFLLAKDLHLELNIIHHRAFLKLLQLRAVAHSELLDRLKKNKVSRAVSLMQEAALLHNNAKTNYSSKTKNLLEEASNLIKKAGNEERKLYMSNTPKTPTENKDKGMKGGEENPPPPPILLSRTDHSLTFAPAPYNLEGQVCYYELFGQVAESINQKVRLGDCNLPGTGNMVPAGSDACVLRVEGLETNQKYVFAVAAYNSQGKLLGNTIGQTTSPLLASMPVPLMSAWAHLAQVAFQTEQYAIAKRACRELWSHYTYLDCGSHSTQDRFAATGLHKQTLQYSSPHLCRLFLTSIFIETEINIQQGSLYSDSFSDSGPFSWEQEARLAECERMLVAMDLAMCLNDGSVALQAVVKCYGLLTPLIFHQIPCDSVVQVLKKCLTVLEENSGLLKQKWAGNTSESTMHMIGCITYYLSKTLRVLKKHETAAEVMDCGCRLLHEVYDAQQQISRCANQAQGRVAHAAVKDEMKISLQLKALHGKNNTRIISEAALTTDNEISQTLTGCEDPTKLYDLISSNPLKDAYQEVIKLRHQTFFLEFAALLLQRTMEEGHPDLVLNWGQSMFQILVRRDEGMGPSKKYLGGNNQSKRRSSVQAPKENETPQNKNTPSHDDTRKRLKEKLPRSMLQRVRNNREMQVVENLFSKMSVVVQRLKKQHWLRNLYREERVWRSHLNYLMAQAHLAQFYQGLDQLHGGALQYRYSHFNPLHFSLAYSGVLLQRNSQTQQSSQHEAVSERDSSDNGVRDCVKTAPKNQNEKEAVRVDDSVTEKTEEEQEEEEESSSQTVEQQMGVLLDSLRKAASHLLKAMVLAHRGSHWTLLRCVCHSMWDHSCRITDLIQRATQLETSSPADQLHTIFTPLLVTATDLIMDMLNKLGLWSLYDSDLTEEQLESSLHFSPPLDDSTQVDLRWIRTLVLYTLERLHDSGKWESLAHFALLFNSYTRERYALSVTPLLVHAQRRLLERISAFGGPVIPQPHHVKTKKVTGKEVTSRNYAGCQLLSGWTPTQQSPIRKKTSLKNSTTGGAVELKGAEMKHSMSLVCVPLDVEDTLRCYHQALEKKPHCLQVFQHSRALLVLLLANTQRCFVTQLQHGQSRSLRHSTSRVDVSPVVKPPPNFQLCNLTEEDFSDPNAIYSIPISPDYLPDVTAAYSTSIKYLQANRHDSLRAQALHDKGNLQFFSGNLRAAQSCWSKAVDCALQSSGALEKWDGMSFGGNTMQQTLKQTGLWGCLQAAVLTAKIAQYILFSDISKRTMYCLLSAHLFKCVLCSSMAQPQADLKFASHSIGDELFPGVDLFSEPLRLDLGTTVTSLNFICHWLFAAGYHITILPILALYLHFVGTVCRDVQRTVQGRILKMRTLTEICLFTEAVKEAFQLTQGTGLLLPHGHYIAQTDLQPMKAFCTSKPLLDNVEVLEDLVNCDFTPEVRTLYGPTLCARFNLARVQLLLALTISRPCSPVQDSVEGEACASVTSCLENSNHQDQDRLDTEGSRLKTGEPTVLTSDTEREELTPERINVLLLEGVFTLLSSCAQQLTSLSCGEMENLELKIESKLLQANFYLQQGHATLSSKAATSALVLLQRSPVMMRDDAQKSVDEQKHLYEDCPSEVEAGERVGIYLWMRCRLAQLDSLAAYMPGTAHFTGKTINEETTRVLQKGLNTCAMYGEHDIQALMKVEGAAFSAQRGKTDDSLAMLKEAVSLLSGRTCMPPRSIVTLAQAILLLTDLRGVQTTTLLQLIQKLLIKQLRVFGQTVVLVDGKMCFSPSGPSNIYLPYISMLEQTTLQIGYVQDRDAMDAKPVSAQMSQSPPGQGLHQCSTTERDSSPK